MIQSSACRKCNYYPCLCDSSGMRSDGGPFHPRSNNLSQAPTEKPQGAGAVPPRAYAHKFRGDKYCWARSDNISFEPWAKTPQSEEVWEHMEFLSIQEHQQLLDAAVLAARAEAFEDAAKYMAYEATTDHEAKVFSARFLDMAKAAREKTV